jgi:rubrerythrin
MSDNEQDTALLREILARELETINVYQSLLASALSPEVGRFLAHIIDEEKEHVAESMELINSLDKAQASRFGLGNHWRKDYIGPEESRESGSAFTVGSLRAGQGERQ